MNKKEIMELSKTFYPSSDDLILGMGPLLATQIEQLVINAKEKAWSDEELGMEIRETVQSIQSISKSQIKKMAAVKIKKLKDDIRVYKNTLAAMEKRLQKMEAK